MKTLDAETLKVIESFKIGPVNGWPKTALFTPDGRHLITGNGNGTVYILRLQKWSVTLGK